MDCPRCTAKLKNIMQIKKHLRIPLQRRYQGGIVTMIKGDMRSSAEKEKGCIPTNGMIVTSECKSCHWKSIATYNKGNHEWITKVM